MEPPPTVGALMELVHGAIWMRTAIRRFSEQTEPLDNLLESQYSNATDPPEIENSLSPSPGMGDEHNAAFTSHIEAIAHQVTLATPDPAKPLCLFTDASSTHWAGVLTQVDPAEIAQYAVLPLEWNHSKVAFVSGSFRGPSSRWTTPEQKKVCDRGKRH